MKTSPANHRRKKATSVAIGAILQYAKRIGGIGDTAVVRFVAESRNGWFVIERRSIDGGAVRRHVKATHLTARSVELF
jgi:hypothetical protein